MVVAVVLTWNDTEMSAGCVRSILDGSRKPDTTVLVDNGSSPLAGPILKEQFPELEVVQLSENQGFTGGCNRGIERALELGADYVFLLNNDTIVHPDAVAKLIEAMEHRPDAAFASALLLYPGDGRRVQFYRGSIRRDVARHTHAEDGKPFDEGFRETVETEFAPACAILIRAEAIRQVGLFDERLFTNWEDYDLCLRFADAGWKILTVGAAEVIHAHGQTTGRISPFITYFYTRNRLICLFRHARLLDILRNSPLILRTFYWQTRRQGWTNWPAQLAMLKGILYFFLGIRGKHGVPTSREG